MKLEQKSKIVEMVSKTKIVPSSATEVNQTSVADVRAENWPACSDADDYQNLPHPGPACVSTASSWYESMSVTVAPK